MEAVARGVFGSAIDAGLRIIMGLGVDPIIGQIIILARNIILLGGILIGEDLAKREMGGRARLGGFAVGFAVTTIAGAASPSDLAAELMTGDIGSALGRELGAIAIGAVAGAAVGAGQGRAVVSILIAPLAARIAGGKIAAAATAGLGLAALAVRRVAV
jgi:hypothetical protein